MEEFLNSKSMLTPGMAGLSTTMITATLVSVFQFPGTETGLAVSFVLGLLILADKDVSWPQRLLFYVINSITIFTMAVGINEAGVTITMSKEQAAYESRWVPPQTEEHKFFQSWF